MSTNRGLLVVAPAAYPLGGLATWLDGLLPGLEEKGWTVRLALPRGRTYDLDEYLSRHPWPRTVLLENRTGTCQGRRRALRKLLRGSTEEIAVVVNQPEVLAAAVHERAVGRRTPRLVATLHGFVPEIVEDFRWFAPVLTAAVGMSRLACEVLRRASELESRRVFHALHGTTLDSPPEFSQFPPCDSLELLYVGRLEEKEKRVSDLPLITAILDEQGVRWRLWIVGSGPAEGPLRKALGEDERVIFTGELRPDQLRDGVFQLGRVLIVASEAETGPLVAWEAMERGVVLVTSEFLGLRAEGVLHDGVNCRVFAVGDVLGASRSLIELANSRAEMSRLAQAGRRTVEEKYSLETSIHRWDEILSQVLELDLPSGSLPRLPAPRSGRLDRWLGSEAADVVRLVTGKRGRAFEPGDEWPHALSTGRDLILFRESVRELENKMLTARCK